MVYKYPKGVYDNDNNLISIEGYKSFNCNCTNMYGKVFVTGKKYHCDGKISFGLNGNGYHFAYNLEDTIRYSDCDSNLKNCPIAQVIGSGEILIREDIHNGYDDLFVCSDIEVVKYLTRDEIIFLALSLPQMRMVRFVSQYELTEEEQELFYYTNAEVAKAIDYYQRGIKDTYTNYTKYLKYKR